MITKRFIHKKDNNTDQFEAAVRTKMEGRNIMVGSVALFIY